MSQVSDNERVVGGGRIGRLVAKRIENQLALVFKMCIPHDSHIGDNLKIVAPYGIRIGRTTIIGDNCMVYPFFMTISSVKGDDKRKGMRRHPKIGDNCVLGPYATVIGAINIGDDVIIDSCAIVTKNVPSHSIVKGTNEIIPKLI